MYRGDGRAVVEVLDDHLPELQLQLVGDGLLTGLTQAVDASAILAARCADALRERDWEGDAELVAELRAALGRQDAPDLETIAVDLDELPLALEVGVGEDPSRVDLHTGEVRPASAIEYAIDEGGSEVDFDDEDRWLDVPPQGPEGATATCRISGSPEPDRGDRLLTAIDGKGAFRRFKECRRRKSCGVRGRVLRGGPGALPPGHGRRSVLCRSAAFVPAGGRHRPTRRGSPQDFRARPPVDGPATRLSAHRSGAEICPGRIGRAAGARGDATPRRVVNAARNAEERVRGSVLPRSGGSRSPTVVAHWRGAAGNERGNSPAPTTFLAHGRVSAPALVRADSGWFGRGHQMRPMSHAGAVTDLGCGRPAVGEPGWFDAECACSFDRDPGWEALVGE